MEYVLWWIEGASWYGKLSFVTSREVDEVDESGNSMTGWHSRLVSSQEVIRRGTQGNENREAS